MCGTPNFISPEVATRSAHGLEADIWGMGCLLYTLLVGTPPFDTSGVKSTLTKVVMSNYTLPAYLSIEAKDLIDAMLKKNPSERIKLSDIPNHPWLVGAAPILQDSGMFTMTTGFSVRTSVASSSAPSRHPETKPMLSKPVSEYPTRRPPPVVPQVRSEPLLAPRLTNILEGGVGGARNRFEADEYSSSPPVRMRTDPRDLPAPALFGGKFVGGQTVPSQGLSRSNSIPRMQPSSQNTYRYVLFLLFFLVFT